MTVAIAVFAAGLIFSGFIGTFVHDLPEHIRRHRRG